MRNLLSLKVRLCSKENIAFPAPSHTRARIAIIVIHVSKGKHSDCIFMTIIFQLNWLDRQQQNNSFSFKMITIFGGIWPCCFLSRLSCRDICGNRRFWWYSFFDVLQGRDFRVLASFGARVASQRVLGFFLYCNVTLRASAHISKR